MWHVNRTLDKVQNVVEYLLALALIVSAVGLIGQDSIHNHGILASIVGGDVAFYIYMAWFFFLGLTLIYAKVKRKKRLHKHMLLAIYLTTIYTSILTVGVFGLHWTQIIDDVMVGLLAAIFWMRWKFRTEYIDPHQYYSEVKDLGGDPPPLP